MDAKLLILALAPVAILLAYTLFRDKYEKEPWQMLIKALLLGAVSTIPALFVETFLSAFNQSFSEMTLVFWNSFVVTAFTEEFFKLLFLYLLIWKSAEFNEKFDGIVYAVFISLGFAAVENIMYVFDYGTQVGYIRALTAVPAHFLFGINMGYFVGMAKFYPDKKGRLMRAALLYPLVLHGLYDFILMSEHPQALIIFLPFVFFMWKIGIKKMKQLSDNSIYKNDFGDGQDLFKN